MELTEVPSASIDHIFSDSEFEDDKFHAASFVAKHRRVTSLDSLRDQLRTYCGALKQQLYSIINRDYKDFITIATKLDGVDMRVEHLRKPLVDLRLDLANLHDGMVSSMRTIEDKLQNREEVVTRRRMLEAMLACMEKLDLAEEVVLFANQAAQPNSSTGLSLSTVGAGGSLIGSGTGTARAPKRRDLIRSFARSHGVTAYATISRDVFDCSELERAAHAVAQAKSYLQSLQHHSNSSTTGSHPSGTKRNIPGGSVSLVAPKPLEQRVTRLEDLLVQRVRARLVAIFSSCMTSTSTSTATSTTANASVMTAEDSMAAASSSSSEFKDSTPSSSSSAEPHHSHAANHSDSSEEFPARAFAHCLRALVALGRGEVAEEAVADTITRPLARQLLTQGRVDGTGGRGSYAGLQEALEQLAVAVFNAVDVPKNVCLETFPMSLIIANPPDGDALSTVPPPVVDLIANGVWRPVAALLAERFPGMFSVGIANTMARCYTAVERFAVILERDQQQPQSASTTRNSNNGNNSTTSSTAPSPFKKAVAKFKQNWKFELYLQLRTQEITGRLDVACQLVNEHGLVTKVADALYSTKDTLSSSSSSGGDSTGGVGSNIMSGGTLTHQDMASVRAQALPTHLKVNLPITKAFMIELMTCLHPSVALSAVSSQLFALAVRLMVRFEALAAIASESPTPSFPKHTLASLIQHIQENAALATTAAATATASGVVTTTATPAKGIPTSVAAVASTTSSSAATKTNNPPPGPSAQLSAAVSPLTSTTAVGAGVGGVQPTVPSQQGAAGVGAQMMIATASMDDLILLAADLAVVATWIMETFSGLVDKTFPGNAIDSTSTSGTSQTLAMTPTRKLLHQQNGRLLGAREAVWDRVSAMLSGDCKKGLTAVRAIAAKYRMTNKPPPDAPSPYVETILQPLKQFLDRHGPLLAGFKLRDGGKDTSTSDGSSGSVVVAGAAGFALKVLEDVTAAFLQQVQGLMETVKQMDSALQRRSKVTRPGAGATAATGGGASTMIDSDKISLQLFLDVKAFGMAVCATKLLPTTTSNSDDNETLVSLGTILPSFAGLWTEVAPSEKLLLEK